MMTKLGAAGAKVRSVSDQAGKLQLKWVAASSCAPSGLNQGYQEFEYQEFVDREYTWR